MEEKETNGVREERNTTMRVMVVEVASLAIGFLGMMLMNVGVSELRRQMLSFVDIPTLVVMMIFCVPVLAASGLWNDFLRAFSLGGEGKSYGIAELKRTQTAVRMMQRQVLYAGLMNMVFAVIMLLHSLDTPEQIGPYMAVAFISIFYVSVIEMLLLPLRVEIEKKLIDYMEGV